jgi:hypothetical protein
LGTTESKVEERTRFLENDKVEEKEEIATNEKLERPETYDVESESRLGYGGPRPRPTFETRTKYESKVQKSEFGSRYGLGPRPTLGTRTGYGTHVHKTKGVVRHKPGCPLFEGNLNEERYRSESQSQGGRFGSNTFSGIRREISEVKKYSSTGRYGSRPRIGGSSYSSYNIGSSSLKKKKKSSKTSGSSKYSVLKTTTTTTSGKRTGRNYNYFESKDIKKKKKKKQPTTTF